MGVTTDKGTSHWPGVGSVAPPSIPDVVCTELRRWIASGQLAPGPLKISQLAKHFGVSTVPVREALRRLEAEGFVSFDHNRSVKVNQLSIVDIREIFVIRCSLEPILVERAAPLVASDPTLVRQLDSHVEAMDDAIADVSGWREANAAFHWAIYSVAPLPRLRSVVAPLWTAAEPFLRLYVSGDRAVLREAQAEHRELVRLLCGGNGAQAALLLQTHLEKTLQSVEERLGTLATTQESGGKHAS